MQQHGWNLIPGVALTAFCSLRVSEALRLTWDDFDGETIHIKGKKTDLSERLIPAPKIIVMILSEAPRKGPRILESLQDIWSYGHAFKRYIDKRGRGKIEPKGLRRTIPSEFMRRGWYGDMMQLYRGHQPKGISKVDLDHYAVIDEEWLLKQMKEQVVDRIDEATADLCRYWRGRDSGQVVQLR